MEATTGRGVFETLKWIAVFNLIGAVVIGGVVIASATESRLTFSAFGEPSVTDEADPVMIAIGAAIIGEGIVVTLVLWAIGTIGHHIIELRRVQSASTAKASRPLPESLDERHEVYLIDAGKDPQRIVDLLVAHAGIDRSEAESRVRSPRSVVHATADIRQAQALAENLRKAGARVDVLFHRPRST